MSFLKGSTVFCVRRAYAFLVETRDKELRQVKEAESEGKTEERGVVGSTYCLMKEVRCSVDGLCEAPQSALSSHSECFVKNVS